MPDKKHRLRVNFNSVSNTFKEPARGTASGKTTSAVTTVSPEGRAVPWHERGNGSIWKRPRHRKENHDSKGARRMISVVWDQYMDVAINSQLQLLHE